MRTLALLQCLLSPSRLGLFVSSDIWWTVLVGPIWSDGTPEKISDFVPYVVGSIYALYLVAFS